MTALALTERTIPHLLERALAVAPTAPLLVTREREWSYAEAAELVVRLAAGLARHGIGVGTHVALMMGNSPDYVWTVLALARLGAVGVTLNTQSKGEILAYYLGDSRCQVAIVDDELAAEFRPVAAAVGLDAVLVRQGDRWLEDVVETASQPMPEYQAAFSGVFLVLYTSGTTGMPKGVPVTHAHAITCGLIFAEYLGITRGDRLYTCLPLFHINALGYTLCGALATGASVALSRRFSASGFWDEVRALGATQVNAMGSMLRMLQTRDGGAAERTHAVRKVFVAPLPPDAAALGERFNVAFSTTYAQTEWVPSSMTRPGEGYGSPGFTGEVLPHSEVRIVDDRDLPVASGTLGEIVLRAHDPYITFNGYLDKPAETLEAFRNLRFHTGDIGSLGADGCLYFHGRLKDVIRRRGENVSAMLLETTLCRHADIAEVAVVPVPSALLEEEIYAFVTLRDAAEMGAREFLAFAQEMLPRYMVPLYVDFVDDFPRTSTNKVAKELLRQLARERLARGAVKALA